MPISKHKQQALELSERGEVLHGQGDREGAAIAFRKALQCDHDCATAWNNLGVQCYESKAYQDAVHHLRTALWIDPRDSSAALNLGRLWRELGRSDKARDVYLSYLRTSPGDQEVSTALGTIAAEDDLGGARRDPPLAWADLKHLVPLRLYAGDIALDGLYEGVVGLSLTQHDHRHIRHDIRRPMPLPDDSVDGYQSEDVFEHIEYDELLSVVNEVFRVLRPTGTFRLSVPDYRCDVLFARSVKDSSGNVVFDPVGGGTPAQPGHVWFPRLESVQQLFAMSAFARRGTIEFLHYYRPDGSYVVKPIDYTKGHVSRTPDFDERVMHPYRPMSLVVDAVKGRQA